MASGPILSSDNSVPEAVPALRSPGAFSQTLVSISAGSIAAILSVKAIEQIGEVFVLPPDLAGLAFGQVPPPETQAKLLSAVYANNLRNAAVWMGAVGAIFGACYGLAMLFFGGQRSPKLRILLTPLFMSTVFMAVSGVVGVAVDANSRRHMPPDATSPSEPAVILVHGLVWLISGLGIGTGVALGGRHTLRTGFENAVVVGLLGMVGGCLFPIAAGILFPAVDSSLPIPGVDPTSGRILWLTLPAFLMGFAINRNHGPSRISDVAK